MSQDSWSWPKIHIHLKIIALSAWISFQQHWGDVNNFGPVGRSKNPANIPVTQPHGHCPAQPQEPFASQGENLNPRVSESEIIPTL